MTYIRRSLRTLVAASVGQLGSVVCGDNGQACARRETKARCMQLESMGKTEASQTQAEIVSGARERASLYDVS